MSLRGRAVQWQRGTTDNGERDEGTLVLTFLRALNGSHSHTIILLVPNDLDVDVGVTHQKIHSHGRHLYWVTKFEVLSMNLRVRKRVDPNILSLIATYGLSCGGAS